ncbi:multicopper oxidase domain-containing protein [Actinomadura namibiensis]|uniref:Plastocyanin-like domain-containing protein n=1 Tax=Actinomadura namibiensis TaxID=182080 RepID=A0A7W3QLX5_ACTNM|nr:multicopper oxidase domain-containing protein [Actinomadura namibiensis]MBA8951911.1 hypothetical protein [Actinomadura namibiensis]
MLGWTVLPVGAWRSGVLGPARRPAPALMTLVPLAFRVLDVAGSPPPAYANGHKDTVGVPSKSTVRLAVQFGHHTDPASPYMYHCHIPRHEDSGMMGPFVIVRPGTENQVPRTLPGAGHGR